ncbi:MAG: outer membrane lipoprotein carrier protein LolA, partial [Rhizobium sp.]|nr:outer membrane lipoprotein carrier protein LolA [Rhizobium sp.]
MTEHTIERLAGLPASKTRRQLIAGATACVALAALPMPAVAAADPVAAQKIADHFSSVKTMMGEFVQFG